LGIAAPRTKSDDVGRITDGPTLAAISSLAEQLLGAAAAPARELVDRASDVVSSLGVDTDHIPPAA
jgi:hypothetical protein